MKLSDMKAMLSAIESTLKFDEDPDIRFYIPRNPQTLERLNTKQEKDGSAFIEFVIDESYPIADCKILAITKGTIQHRGDYTIPLLVAPFYE